MAHGATTYDKYTDSSARPPLDMSWDQLRLCPRVSAALKKAKLTSLRAILCISGLDLQRLTGLSCSDVQQLFATATATCRQHPPVPAVLMQRGQCLGLDAGLRLSVGCPVLDTLLRGGLPVGGITELSGESGAGKTQLALQVCLSVQYPPQHGGLGSGAVYICTEDSFPIKRLQQLIADQPCLRSDAPTSLISSLHFSDHVYVEHTADLDALRLCLSVRVPLLLARRLVRLLVIDSVAAPFRSGFQADDWVERNKQLINLSFALHHLSHEYSIPVLCVNQVTDVFRSDNNLCPLSPAVSPALGLAWANQVTVRLMMRRLPGTVTRSNQSSALRRLDVVFAPHLARDGRDAAVWREGVRGITATLADGVVI